MAFWLTNNSLSVKTSQLSFYVLLYCIFHPEISSFKKIRIKKIWPPWGWNISRVYASLFICSRIPFFCSPARAILFLFLFLWINMHKLKSCILFQDLLSLSWDHSEIYLPFLERKQPSHILHILLLIHLQKNEEQVTST